MVFYFTCSDPRYTIYMGRDKFENESLIAYGWPEDLWFHVDKLSSAHVYLRLPPEIDFESVPMELVHECAQLCKLNSIEGCKLNNVPIVYTPWANLKKTGEMKTGQVGFHNRAAVRSVTIERRVNEIVNRLNKTKVEKHNNPAELFEIREAKFARELKEKKAVDKMTRKGAALEKNAEREAQMEREHELKKSEAEMEEAQRVMQARPPPLPLLHRCAPPRVLSRPLSSSRRGSTLAPPPRHRAAAARPFCPGFFPPDAARPSR
jgi:hypothetical protein